MTTTTTGLPSLNVHGANMTEEVPEMLLKGREVFFLSTIAYIEMYLMNAVQDAINTPGLPPRLTCLVRF
jgi:hypothetical protein